MVRTTESGCGSGRFGNDGDSVCAECVLGKNCLMVGYILLHIYKFIVTGVAYALIDYIIEKKFNKNE